MSFEQIVYRDIWADDLRLIIEGKDYTYFRRTATQFGGYQLQQPYGYGPADFSFPQITGFEVADLGVTGPLKRLRKGAVARLVPVTDGVRGQDVWRGILTTPRVSGGTIQVHCDGEASGRLVLRDKHPALAWFEKDLGILIYDAFKYCNLPMTPRLGTHTGIPTENRGGGTDYLQWVTGLLADAIDEDLDQYTIAPTWVGGRHTYELVKKDTTTIHATVFYGSEGVTEDLASEIQEEPNNWFGFGTEPDGQKWNHAVYPGAVDAEAPPFPGVMSEGDTNATTGDMVSVMHWMLIGRGFMTREEAGGTYDAETVEAVQDLQEEAGLPETGIMDADTWDALYDLSVTGLDVNQAQWLPLAQASSVKKWDRTASGALKSRHDGYDPDETEVDITVDHGAGSTERRAKRWSKRQLKRVRNGKNWTGTLEFDGADLFVGNVTAATVNPTVMSRLDLRPGMNIMFRGFDGDTVLHAAGINVDGDKKVRAAVDTKARDLQTVGQIIARNKPSRRDPRREFIQATRGRNFDSMIIWNKLGGKVPAAVTLPGGQWTDFKVLAGQSGIIERLLIQLDNSPTEYVMAVGARRGLQGALRQHANHPFTVDGDAAWTSPAVQRRLKRDHLVLYTAGQRSQPCGYSPGMKNSDRTDTDGNPIPTGDSITGEHEDDGGINFHTFAEPVLYVGIYPVDDTKVQPGRIMWPLQTEGS